jgi:hypothetical protein
MHINLAKSLVKQSRHGIPITLHEDYSGRDMFGKTTAAVVVPDQRSLLLAVASYAAACGTMSADGLIDAIPDFRFDDLGRDLVVY